MNDIESKFLDIMNNNFSQQNREEPFAICPKAFYSGLSNNEVNAMIKLYTIAYEKAKIKTQNKLDSFYNK